MSSSDAEGPTTAKEPRVACKYKHGLLISYGVPVPVDGVSECHFSLTFGIERKFQLSLHVVGVGDARRA
jgi:hypothetical protein